MAERPDLVGLIVDLAEAGVEFVVCGGVACVLWGVDRVTMDLDIRVPEEEENYKRLLHVLAGRGLSPRIPEPAEHLVDPARRSAWVKDEGALVWTAQSGDGLEQIDVFLDYPIGWDDLVRDARRFHIRGQAVRVSSREHLVAAKRAVHPPRRKDLRDLEDLEALP